MISSRKIEDLHPKIQPMAREFERQCQAAGIDVIFTSTYRDAEAQATIYAQGRTAPGAIVTNAKPGESWHNYRLAFDFAPVVNGKVPWNDAALFTRCGLIAEKCGLEWAGRWTGKMKEMAHCQYTGGLTLAQLQAGQTLA